MPAQQRCPRSWAAGPQGAVKHFLGQRMRAKLEVRRHDCFNFRSWRFSAISRSRETSETTPKAQLRQTG